MRRILFTLALLLSFAMPMLANRTVYYDNSVTKWQKVMVFYWGAPSGNPEWGQGNNMTKVDGYDYLYSASIPDKVIGMLFYNGSDNEGNQSDDIYNNDIVDNGVWKIENTQSKTVTYLGSLEEYIASLSGSGNESGSGEGEQNADYNLPDLYLTGVNYGGWTPTNGVKFNRTGATYSLTVPVLNGQFKIAKDDDWTFNYGSTSSYDEPIPITGSGTYYACHGGKNWTADHLQNVTITFSATVKGNTASLPDENQINFAFEGSSTGGDPNPNPDPDPNPGNPDVSGLSGTLPVLYINIYDAEEHLDNSIIDKDLADKNYRSGSYWLDLNGCQWMADLGAKSIGSPEDPLPLEMKARGNYTRTGFSKKPFKLKLGAKQNLLNMGNAKSKHWTLLAHADDNFGYLRNFVGFNLGKRMGLPWVPSQQPIEVVINGDYRGLYFLTEGIRVGDGRVMIEELKDNCEDVALASGGYLVELDNYDEPEESQIQLNEQSCDPSHPSYYLDKLRVTFNTPEEYSALQRRFVTDQFTAMNNYVGANSDELWKYMDLDDAARYYVVEEIVSHTESYHGSTYLFRDRGENQKWHFSPLWDFGNAFNGSTNNFFYNCDLYGNTWIPSMRRNATFNNKVRESWLWFMSNCYDGLMQDINEYVDHIRAAAIADHKRWGNAPLPSYGNNNPSPVVDNSDMTARRDAVVNHLYSKINWLKGQFGDYTNGNYDEPARDNTEAAPLPQYLDPNYKPSKVYVYNDAEWNGINAFIYNGNGQVQSWPGVSISDYDKDLVYTDGEGNRYEGLYTYEIPYEFLNSSIIFSEANGSRRYPADQQPGMAMGDGSLIFFTSWDHIAQNPDISVKINTSGTLPIVKINTADNAEPGYGDEGVVACTFSIDPLATGEAALEPTAGEIKGRGNNWGVYDKKAYKLKLGSKSAVLDMNKSKHWVLLPYVEDKDNGLVSNYAGHVLAEYLDLNWTPDIKPVEVIFNGEYIGLYFIGENVRADSKRVPVTDFGEKNHVAGEDWLLEVDNLATDDVTEYSWTANGNTMRIVPAVPEFTDLTADQQTQYRSLLADNVEALKAAVAAAKANPESKDWMELIDADQAARFYIVNEVMDCADAFSTSFYLYHTSGEKWKFGPVWNFNGAFTSGASKSSLIHQAQGFDGAFIADLYANNAFHDLVINIFDQELATEGVVDSRKLPGSKSPIGLTDAIEAMGASLADAIAADAEVWPDYSADANAYSTVSSNIMSNIRWLADSNGAGWNKSGLTSIGTISTDSDDNAPGEYFDLTGRRVENPAKGSFVIYRKGTSASKVIVR